jgi:5-(hydroxymethyl)furfural/furfural oxidase
VNLKNAVMMAPAGWMLDGPESLRRTLFRKQIIQGPGLKEILANESMFETFVRSTTNGIKHLSCTCRMGRAEDPMAVIDTEGRVRGIGGLRVVDASSMPSLPRANSNLATIMLAEKMADHMLGRREASVEPEAALTA